MQKSELAPGRRPDARSLPRESHVRRSIASCCSLICWCLLVALPVHAQTQTATAQPESSAEQTAGSVEAQLARALELLQSQQAALAEQRTLLSEQSQRIDRLQAELDDIRNPATGALATPVAGGAAATQSAAAENPVVAAIPAHPVAGADSAAVPAQQIPAQQAVDTSIHAAAEKTASIAAITEEAQTAQQDDPTRDLLAALPGAMRLPGTNAVMRIGGYVKTDYVQSFDPLAVTDRFIPGRIPVDAAQSSNLEAENVITVSQSRLSLDLREPTDVGLVRAYVEGDFAGSNDTFRLRHAFGQRGNVLAGQTWSGFVDRSASPEEIDFEGLNGRINVRQAQVRVQPGMGKKYELALSLEDPDPEVTNGQSVNRFPDFVVSGRVNWGQYVHARLALLLRQVRAKWDGEPGNTGKDIGWGLSYSGRIDVPLLDPRDNVLFQLNVGTGYGRYVNDLNSTGDFDGIFSPTGELELIDVVAGYVAFQHWWAGTLRSTATLGWVSLNNPDFVPDDFYKRTWRSSVNLMWSPTPRVEVGTELLWGRRENEDGNQGDATQLQIAAKYLF